MPFIIRPSFLSIPVDPLPTEEVVHLIQDRIEKKSGSPLTISFLDGSFLKRSIPWFSDDGVNEAILAKREEDIVLPRLGTLGWSLLDLGGNEPKYHDLFPKLFSALQDTGEKILFLGHDQQKLQTLLDYLKEHYPNLSTDALLSDSLHISGEDLIEGEEEENLLLNKIIQDQPSILFVLSRHPALEIWRRKIKKKLKVPALILLDQKEEGLLFGKKPTWFQAHLCGKLTFLTLPLLIKEFFVKKRRCSSLGKIRKLYSDDKELYLLELPERLSGPTRESLKRELEPYLLAPLLLVDFTKLKEFDAKGLQLLEALWKREGLTFGFGMQKCVEINLRHHRTLDLFLPHHFEKKEQFLRRLEEVDGIDPLYWGVEPEKGVSNVLLLGPLDARQDQTNIYNHLTGKLREPKTIIDFSLCPFIDSSGLGLLLRLRKYHQQLRREMILTGLNSSIEQTFKIAKVDTLFTFKN